MKTFEVWSEGYAITGDRGTAQFLGHYNGNTFKDAALKAMDTPDRKTELRVVGDDVYYWGCKLFSSEKEARINFG